MAEIRKFIKKEPVSLAELAEEIKKAEDKKEPVAVQQQVKDYAIRFSKINKEKAAKLAQAIHGLDIPLLNENQAMEMVNVLPQNMTELQTVFAGSKITVAPENLKKLLEVIKTHEK